MLLLTIVLGVLLFTIIAFIVIQGFFESAKRKISFKLKMALIIIVAILFFISLLTYAALLESYTQNPIISNIDISDVYKMSDVSYAVRSEDNDMYIIKTREIYNGDSNYLIKIEYPKMSKNMSVWLSHPIVEYKIVVENPDNILEPSIIE